MYAPSSCTHLTPQGIAIKEAAVRFGDGQTLPFSPCKRGYIPIVGGERRYACHLHHEQRMKRVKNEGGLFRQGEEELSRFWNVNHSNGKTCKNEQIFSTRVAKKGKASKLEKNGANEVFSSRHSTLNHDK